MSCDEKIMVDGKQTWCAQRTAFPASANLSDKDLCAAHKANEMRAPHSWVLLQHPEHPEPIGLHRFTHYDDNGYKRGERWACICWEPSPHRLDVWPKADMPEMRAEAVAAYHAVAEQHLAGANTEQLRAVTGCGRMDARKAMTASDGDAVAAYRLIYQWSQTYP